MASKVLERQIPMVKAIIVLISWCLKLRYLQDQAIGTVISFSRQKTAQL